MIQVETHITSKLTDEKDKATFVLDHLKGSALLEVKFRVVVDKASSGEILDALGQVFSKKETVLDMQQKFYSANQVKGQSLTDYSYVLMEIFFEMKKKDPRVYTDVDKPMKARFADGVLDSNLRRELKRLNDERADMKFHELRQAAFDWIGDSKRSSVPQLSSTASACTSDENVTSTHLSVIMPKRSKVRSAWKV